MEPTGAMQSIRGMIPTRVAYKRRGQLTRGMKRHVEWKRQGVKRARRQQRQSGHAKRWSKRERRCRMYTEAPCFRHGPRERGTLPRGSGCTRLSPWTPSSDHAKIICDIVTDQCAGTRPVAGTRAAGPRSRYAHVLLLCK